MTVTETELLPKSSQDHRWAISGAISFAVAFGLLFQALAVSAWPTQAVVWGGIAFAFYTFGLLCAIGALQSHGVGFARWKFAPWILIWYVLAYGISTITWSKPQIGNTVSMIMLPSVLRALWLVAIGVTAWVVGYLVGPGSITKSITANGIARVSHYFTSDVRSLSAPWILYAIGTAARVVSAITTGRYGYIGDTASSVTATAYGQIISTLGACAQFAVVAAALQVFRERRPTARVTLIVLVISELAATIISGNKGNFLNVTLEIAIPYCATRNRLPKATLISTFLIFMVIITPFTAAYRNAVNSSPAALTSSQAAQKAPAILRHTLNMGMILTAVPSSIDYLLQRVQEIDNSAVILQLSPGQVPYVSPAELMEIPLTGFVPRAVWHNKPLQLAMYQVSQEYYGQPATVYTAAGITPVGDLYRHGGWIPVITGMLFLGCAIRLLDDVLDIRRNPQIIFLLVLLYPTVVVAESGWIAIFSGIPLTVMTWLFAVAITFRRQYLCYSARSHLHQFAFDHIAEDSFFCSLFSSAAEPRVVFCA